MLNALIRLALAHRLLTLALAALLVVAGGGTLRALPVDVLPDLNRPTVTIFTEAPGLAPEEVESLVTWPLESALNGATGVRRLRSSSGIGLSILWVEFDWATSVMAARQTVAEKLQQTREQLPASVTPVMGPVASIMGEILLTGLSATDPAITPLELRTLAEWDLRTRLLATPGVAQVTVIGGALKQYQVLVDPFALQSYGRTLHDVREALAESSVNATGGFLFGASRESLIRTMARARDAEDFLSLPLPGHVPETPPVTLRQVATVRVAGPVAPRGDASVNAAPAVILSVQKQPDADTRALTAALAAQMEAFRATLPKGVTLHDSLFRQADFVDRALHNVRDALRDGSLLVVVVLFLFLLNLRATAITVTVIPLAFLLSLLVFKLFGLGINTMTLGGLAIAVGELVDDAIVDVENVGRRLRENRALAAPRPVLEVVREASGEIRNSIVIATVVVALVFAPLFALGGIEGRLFAPLGVAYIVSILASLLVALTVTPVLCSFLLGAARPGERSGETPVVRALKAFQGRLIDALLPRSRAVFAAVGLLFLGAVALTPFLGREFLPPFNEGSLTVNLLLPPGTRLEESNRVGALAEKLILQVPEARATARRTGRAERDDHAEGVHASEIEVDLREGRPRAAILADLRARLETLPGVAVNIGQPISHRIDHMLSGVRAQLAVKIFGPDLDTLRRLAADVEAALAAVPGVVDLSVERQTLIPQVHIRLDREQTARYGLLPGEAAATVEMALQGVKVTEVLDNNRRWDVVLRLRDEARDDRDSLRAIPVDTGRDTMVPLGLIASVEEASGPNLVNRENGARRTLVQANIAGRDTGAVVEEAQRAVAARVALPQGYRIAWDGQYESQKAATRSLAFLGALSLIGLFLVLAGHFRSVALALQVMVAVPLAFTGGVAGLWLANAPLSVASLVGFIALTGIAARNGIMMIAHYLHLMRHEGESFTLSMLRRGTAERIVPVLMTALTASCALVPLLLGADQPGREILHPVAVVIFSGLVTSTLLDLAVRPLLFWRFGRRAAERLVPEAFPSLPSNPKEFP